MTSPISLSIYDELCRRMGEAQPQPRLAATRDALRLLNDPHLKFPFIHVTGTNGKTSTSRIAESILRAHGRHTGLFTSPHLVDFTERIALDGRPITDSALGEAWALVGPVLGRSDIGLGLRGEPPLTFFEALTVLAYTCFAQAEVDCAVIEVGMGGEWDSTNVADGAVAVITPIALDHAAQLGGTIEAIARTKSGIIKSGVPVVTARQQPAARKAIRRAARARGGRIAELGGGFTVSTIATDSGQSITVTGLQHEYEGLELRLLGEHQAENAAVAIASVEFLLHGDLDPAAVAAGVAGARSPGRLERILDLPEVYLDVAHNPAGAETLAVAMSDLADRTSIGVVLGVLDDKDVAGIATALTTAAGTFFVTRSKSARAMPAEDVATAVRMSDPIAEVYTTGDLRETWAQAIRWADSEPGRVVLVTGSATVVGDVVSLTGERRLLPGGRA